MKRQTCSVLVRGAPASYSGFMEEWKWGGGEHVACLHLRSDFCKSVVGLPPGIILWELLTRSIPYQGLEPMQVRWLLPQFVVCHSHNT